MHRSGASEWPSACMSGIPSPKDHLRGVLVIIPTNPTSCESHKGTDSVEEAARNQQTGQRSTYTAREGHSIVSTYSDGHNTPPSFDLVGLNTDLISEHTRKAQLSSWLVLINATLRANKVKKYVDAEIPGPAEPVEKITSENDIDGRDSVPVDRRRKVLVSTMCNLLVNPYSYDVNASHSHQLLPTEFSWSNLVEAAGDYINFQADKTTLSQDGLARRYVVTWQLRDGDAFRDNYVQFQEGELLGPASLDDDIKPPEGPKDSADGNDDDDDKQAGAELERGVAHNPLFTSYNRFIDNLLNAEWEDNGSPTG
ncbi:hypothetical protein CMUS01_07904 [Colletotrichum musicola]|uniref:Uncharacterized protein n=1 Tax=Colletotrichum musicola TaxID=2175873 RepID=A0A8H6NE08_9PEZI|nr:hypothetical protein CMUS01_07904 [Colletotrichum musicola]